MSTPITPIKDPMARIMAAMPARVREAWEAEGRPTVRYEDDPADVRAEVRARRRDTWRAMCPAAFADASVDQLEPEQDPGGRVSGWLASGADKLLLVGDVGTGKCLDADSIVYDPDTGLPHRIEDIVRENRSASTWTVTERGEVTTLPITYRVDSGVKPTLRVTTATGRTVIVTPHHPLLLPEGWRRTDEVKVGETIALPARLPSPRIPAPLSDAEIDLLALLVTEGNCNVSKGRSTGRNVTFSTADPEMLSRAVAAAGALGMTVQHHSRYDYSLKGVLPWPETVPPGTCGCGCGEKTSVFTRSTASLGYVKGQSARFVRFHSTPKSIARAFVERHGIGSLAKDKKMPEAAYRLDDKGLRRFLSVVWMADGYVEKKSGPGITLASRNLVYGIQHLLLRIGVQSSVKHITKTGPTGTKHDAWRLIVLATSRKTFAEQLDLWGTKAQRAEELAQIPVTRRGHGAISSNDAIHKRLFAVAQKLGLTRRPAIHISYTRYGRTMLHRRAVELLAPHSPGLAHLISPDVFWDKVVSIEPAGDRQVYDLTVQPTACFIAQDIVVHNTWAGFAVANAAVAAADPAWVQYYRVPDLIRALQPSSGIEDVTYRYATECDLLWLDDFGSEMVTDWRLEQLWRIIDHRTSNHLRLVASTNLPYDRNGFKDTPEHLRPVTPNLVDTYGLRLVDRLLDGVVTVRYAGRSRRTSAPW